MVRDPLYRAIQEGLGGRLDPEMFERCAVDLLREVYPGLAPIRGGDDGGMDGAIADSRGGTPIPLVVTTAGSVIGNLTGNLESYRGGGGSASEAVLATSRPLTGRQRRNLEKRAGEFGIALRQIHDRADFVGRLYRNPAWRRELLGLTGDPPALSAFPRSPRPWPATELLGRDKEMAWLRTAEGDVVISGQPGVGKTALLGELAREGRGLFVVSADVGKIADAYRELDPDRVFVDDAHLDAVGARESLLGKLLRLRQELGVSFQIIVTTWPGHEIDIRHSLADGQVLRIDPLERSAVANVVLWVNRGFTDVLIGEIIDQSEGRPGLAVTLAQWAQRGMLKDLVNGRLLLSEMKNDLRPSSITLDCLATFALGGQSGMALAGAARVMEIPETHLRGAILPVSSTGVIHEMRSDLTPRRALSIKPAALRHALVRRTYFSGALAKSLGPAVKEVEDAVECTRTLIGVLARGGSVPDNIIRDRLRRHAEAGVGNNLWENYAWTGKEAADWILSNHPEKSGLAAEPALETAPDHALDHLISDIVQHQGDIGSLSGQIRQWVLRGRPGSGTVARRRLLLQRLARYTDITSPEPHDPPHAVNRRESLAKLVLVAFALHFEDIDGDPITRERFNLALGSLPANDVQALGRLWPKALGVLRALGEPGISCAREVVRRWCAGPRVLNQLPETREAARQEVVRMLPGVIQLASGAPGIVLWARRMVATHGLRANPPSPDDPTLPRLFPLLRELAPEDRSERRLRATALEFAMEWANEEPAMVIERMLHYERQRQLLDHHYPNILNLLPDQLAQQVNDPVKWLEALVDRDAPSAWAESFLEAAIAIDPSSDVPWEIIGRHDEYASLSVHFGVCVAGLSASCVNRIVRAVTDHADSLAHVHWRDVPHEWKHRLLQHHDPRVRGSTASGMWEIFRRRPDGALGALWQAAIVECGEAELLREILLTDADVARAWVLHKARVSAEFMSNRATDDSPPDEAKPETATEIMSRIAALDRLGLDEDLVCRACGRLTADDRRDLILAIHPDADVMFFRHLVGGEPDLYAVLLRHRRLSEQAHLAPLDVLPSPERNELVRLARAHGYSDCGVEAPESI